MKFFKPNSKIQVNVNVTEYLINWEPKREVSKPQAAVKAFLRPYWRSHVVLEEFRVPGTRMRVDLLNLTRRLAIEISPSGSHAFNPFFHKNRLKFGRAVARDLSKIDWCAQNGFTLIELGDEDLADLSAEMFLKKYEVTL